MRFSLLSTVLTAAFAKSTMSANTMNEQAALNLKQTAHKLNQPEQALKDAKIIPDVLDDFAPTCRLQILYPAAHKEVLLGNELTPADTQVAPVITVTCPSTEKEDNNRYIIAMTDPDAPSREDPKWSEFCHWIAKVPSGGVLQAKLPDEALRKHRAEQKEKIPVFQNQIIEHMGPAPPPRTGKHRYVFVLLHGDASNLKAPEERKTWGTGKARHGVRLWAKEHGLSVVGANFFYAHNKEQ